MSAGGSSGSSDSRFSRIGSVNTSSFRDITPDQNTKFDTAFTATQPGEANATVDGVLKKNMETSVCDTPFQPQLCDLVKSNMPSEGFIGNENMAKQANVDPYSSSYADNTFNRYATEVGKAQSAVRSGPAMTRGGTAAQGFAQAEVTNDLGLNREQVLNSNRQTDAGISQSGTGMYNQVQSGRNNDALRGAAQGQQNYFANEANQVASAGLTTDRLKMYNDLVPTFTSLASVMNGNETNNLSGRGAQTSSSVGAGVNFCCFIFLESYNGLLPWYVRAYRDQHAPESSERRNGYIRMSRWMVPAMRVSKLARALVNFSMVKPLTSYGKWKLSNGKIGWLFRPIVSFWFKTWELTGK